MEKRRGKSWLPHRRNPSARSRREHLRLIRIAQRKRQQTSHRKGGRICAIVQGANRGMLSTRTVQCRQSWRPRRPSPRKPSGYRHNLSDTARKLCAISVRWSSPTSRSCRSMRWCVRLDTRFATTARMSTRSAYSICIWTTVRPTTIG